MGLFEWRGVSLFSVSDLPFFAIMASLCRLIIMKVAEKNLKCG